MNDHLRNLLNQLTTDRPVFWNITAEVGEFLHELILENNYQTVLEIGTSNGYSAIWLASALEKTAGQLYTIESNAKKRYPLALENFQKSGLKNITAILGHAPEAIPAIPQSFDLAFFDATKHEHLQYFHAIGPRIKTNGIIITDNIDSHREELAQYLSYVKKLPDWHSQELVLGTGLLISKRKY